MWVRATCRLSENVSQVTTAVSSHFLILGEKAAVVDTGVSACAPALLDELSASMEGYSSLDYIFLTHAHFDHVGGIVSLREENPDIQVVASPLTSQLLQEKDLISDLFENNKKIAEAMGLEFKGDLKQWKSALTVDVVVGDGDTIDLGDEIEVKAIACPGHSADTTAYFVLPDGLLQAGEAVGGYHGREILSPAFSHNYGDYLSSLDKLSNLEISGLGLPHAGSLRGDLARRFMVEQRAEAERFFNEVKERAGQGELIEDIADSLVPEWLSIGKVPEGPFRSALHSAVTGMVTAVFNHEEPEEETDSSEPEPTKAETANS